MELATLEAHITELVGHLNSANHRLLTLLAEFDRCKGWAESATQSCAHWLNGKCGINMGDAREKVRAAHALESLPRISAAMERGELSYSKVRAITRIANAATEELLLSIALHGTVHHVECTVRCFRRAQQAEELSREARQQAARKVTCMYDEDGSLIIKASLPAEAGALFMKALDAAAEAAFRERRVSRKRLGPGRIIPRRARCRASVRGGRMRWRVSPRAFSRMERERSRRGSVTTSSCTSTRRRSATAAAAAAHEHGPSLPAETARRLTACCGLS